MPSQSENDINYNDLMQAHLTRVFNERDSARRLEAITEIYTDDAVLYEPPNASAKGHLAINEAVNELLEHMPPNFAFAPLGVAVGHHGVGRLRWQGGPSDGSIIVTGMDVAHFVEGCIHSLYVFIDPTDD